MELLNQIVCGDCLSIIPQLPDNSIDGVLIDPPYGEAMGYDGDETLNSAEELLLAFLRKIEPKLKRNAHLAIFWTMRNVDVCIDALKSTGYTFRRVLSMYIPKGGARPYLGWLPRTQAIVIGQKYLPKHPSEFHRDMAEYLNNALLKSGLTKTQVAKSLNCDSRLVMKWTRVGDPAWCLPTPRFYKPLKTLLKLDDTFDILLDREPGTTSEQRDGFVYQHDTYIVDNQNVEMLHPSQKPLKVVEHIVSCLSPEGGIVLDGFAGSGTTAMACKNTGRNFVAIEISPEFCEIARKRLNPLYNI